MTARAAARLGDGIAVVALLAAAVVTVAMWRDAYWLDVSTQAMFGWLR